VKDVRELLKAALAVAAWAGGQETDMAERQWCFAKNGKAEGPVAESQLRGMLDSGELPGETLVWAEGMSQWAVAFQTESFQATRGPAPPPLPRAAASETHAPLEAVPAGKNAQEVRPLGSCSRLPGRLTDSKTSDQARVLKPLASGNEPRLLASVKGWNWGAFFLSYLWGWYHGLRGWSIILMYYTYILDRTVLRSTEDWFEYLILRLVPVVYLGWKGNAIAWRRRPFQSVAQFRATERVWMYWGIGCTIPLLIVQAALAALSR
jgi:hypothetical protein